MVSASPRKGKKDSPKGGVPSWVLFPPTLLLPIVLPFLILGDASGRIGLTPPLAALASMTYLALVLAYRAFWSRGNRKGSNAVALLANGALFAFMAGFTGANSAFAWAGFAMFLVGLIGAMSLLSPQLPPRFAQAGEMILPEDTDRVAAMRILDAIVFPAAFLELDGEGEERVLASNAHFASLLGKTPDKVTGALFSSLIPPYEEGARFRFVGLEWVPRRSKRGSQALFMLSPLEKPAEPCVVQVLDAIDPGTGLYAQSFMERGGKSDVEGCRRYKRRLAVSIFQLDFNGQGGVPPGDAARRTAFEAFGRMVASNVRACDSAYRAGGEEIILFMPDTAQRGAEAVTSRIRGSMRRMAAVECVELAAAALSDGTVCFLGDEVKSLDHAISEVYRTIGRKGEI